MSPNHHIKVEVSQFNPCLTLESKPQIHLISIHLRLSPNQKNIVWD